jgi:hypothetical protein
MTAMSFPTKLPEHVLGEPVDESDERTNTDARSSVQLSSR